MPRHRGDELWRRVFAHRHLVKALSFLHRSWPELLLRSRKNNSERKEEKHLSTSSKKRNFSWLKRKRASLFCRCNLTLQPKALNLSDLPRRSTALPLISHVLRKSTDFYREWKNQNKSRKRENTFEKEIVSDNRSKDRLPVFVSLARHRCLPFIPNGSNRKEEAGSPHTEGVAFCKNGQVFVQKTTIGCKQESPYTSGILICAEH